MIKVENYQKLFMMFIYLMLAREAVHKRRLKNWLFLATSHTANIFNVIFTVFKCVPIFTVISQYLFLPVLACCDHKIVPQIKKKQFYDHNMQELVKTGKFS